MTETFVQSIEGWRFRLPPLSALRGKSPPA